MPPKGYSEGTDEEDRAQETPQDGEPLSRAQLFTEHLHPGKHQHGQQAGQHQGGACVRRCKAQRNDIIREISESTVFLGTPC